MLKKTTDHFFTSFWEFKWDIYDFKSKKEIAKIASNILKSELPEKTDPPFDRILMYCMKRIVLLTFSGDIYGYEHRFGNSRIQYSYIVNDHDMPHSARIYVDFANEIYFSYVKGYHFFWFIGDFDFMKICIKMRHFFEFVLDSCPNIIISLHEERPSKFTDALMDKILVIDKGGFFIGNKKISDEMPDIGIMVEIIEKWFSRQELNKKEERVLSIYRKTIRKMKIRSVLVNWRRQGILDIKLP